MKKHHSLEWCFFCCLYSWSLAFYWGLALSRNRHLLALGRKNLLVVGGLLAENSVVVDISHVGFGLASKETATRRPPYIPYTRNSAVCLAHAREDAVCKRVYIKSLLLELAGSLLRLIVVETLREAEGEHAANALARILVRDVGTACRSLARG